MRRSWHYALLFFSSWRNIQPSVWVEERRPNGRSGSIRSSAGSTGIAWKDWRSSHRLNPELSVQTFAFAFFLHLSSSSFHNLYSYWCGALSTFFCPITVTSDHSGFCPSSLGLLAVMLLSALCSRQSRQNFVTRRCFLLPYMQICLH